MKIVITLLFLFNILFGEYLIVDSRTIEAGDSNNIIVYDIYKRFSNPLYVSSQNLREEIPLYVKSNSSKAILMRFINISGLKSIEGDTIPISIYFKSVINGAKIPILDGAEFTILDENSALEYRDGNSIIGYIVVEIDNISDTQPVGEYILFSNLSVWLGNKSSNLGEFRVEGSVPLVAIASFNPIDSSYQEGREFIGANIDFGNLKREENSIIKPLFVKSNSNNSFKIRFNTSDMKHVIYPEYVIGMEYFYIPNGGSRVVISNNSDFVVSVGKNSGVDKVGDIEFRTKELNSNLIMGDYRATLNVTITLE